MKKENIIDIRNKKNKKSWCGGWFASVYDRLMEKSVFPNRLNADIDKHLNILANWYKDLDNKNILELGTGSGVIAKLLPKNIKYTGVDISKNLLIYANLQFEKANIEKRKFYHGSASDCVDEIDDLFDICIINLSLNFFENPKEVMDKLKRILKEDCSVFITLPVTERMQKGKKFIGTQFTYKSLKDMLEKAGYKLENSSIENGAIFYGTARTIA